MMVLSALSSMVVVMALLTGQGHCQKPKDCMLTVSQSMLGFMDIKCNCMEELKTDVRNINKLTIDLSGCAELTALDINWQELERGIGARSVTFIGAQINFAAPSRQWNSNLLKIEFRRCLFNTIPPKAFEGLNRLSEIRFLNSYIAKVDSYAISNLSNLTTLEIADSDIDEIAPNAISGLPNIFEIGLVRSRIKMMRQGAIHNLRLPQLPVDQKCPEIDIRLGGERDENAMGDIMARKLESTENLPLPEFGARLLIYYCNFTTFEKEAVESDLFAFVILGGNQFSYLGGSAFKVELSNQCEISALMIVGNFFESVQPGAIAFANGKLRATHKTFFVMTNNTFEYVAEGGFLLHPSIEIFTVQDNMFVCNCQFFEWLMGEAATTRQQELERDLLMNGKCTDQKLGVDNFTLACNDDDYTPSITRTTHPDGAMGRARFRGGGWGRLIAALSSSAAVGCVSWLLILATVGIVICLEL